MSHEPDPDQLVELAGFPTELEAQILVAQLDDAGIEAKPFGTAAEGIGFISANTMPHGGTQVRVRRADLERAMEVLRTFESERADNDVDNDNSGESDE